MVIYVIRINDVGNTAISGLGLNFRFVVIRRRGLNENRRRSERSYRRRRRCLGPRKQFCPRARVNDSAAPIVFPATHSGRYDDIAVIF